MRTRDRRINQLKHVIDAAPVRPHLLRDAYEWFTDFGELPEDDDSVAYAVVLQAMNGGTAVVWSNEQLHPSRRPSLAARAREALDKCWPPTVRAMLFEEALFEPEPLRRIARNAIACEVAYGGDVENAAFGARHGLPTYGSVALHVVGFERRVVVPPYEFQAQRLLVRLDNIRGRIPQDDPRWFEVQVDAILRFHQTGELPNDDLQSEAVLAQVEIDQLNAHRKGKDVAKALALLNTIAWRRDDAAQALKKICAMAAAGQLRGTLPSSR